jgi:hypothetical protein
MKKVPLPLYSPDLISFNLFLFANIKRMLSGYAFDTPNELFSTIDEILNDNTKQLGSLFFETR